MFLRIFKKMKNKNIRLIIFLASVALAGVLINQGFWINKEILIQKSEEMRGLYIADSVVQTGSSTTRSILNNKGSIY